MNGDSRLRAAPRLQPQWTRGAGLAPRSPAAVSGQKYRAHGAGAANTAQVREPGSHRNFKLIPTSLPLAEEEPGPASAGGWQVVRRAPDTAFRVTLPRLVAR